MMNPCENKTIVITGGTGSLGKVLVRRLLSGDMGFPKKIIIFSRDEAKQYFMRMAYNQKKKSTEEILYSNFQQIIEFRIGDIRNYHSVCAVLKDADIVINTAALKQVPSCEYFPFEAVQTNIIGAENITQAIRQNNFNVETVIGVSTDKACKPINVMGMTKALQERIFTVANITVPETRFVCVRYGNVLASRGSVIPLFHEQIQNGGPVTITSEDMTRFLLSIDHAVDTIFTAITSAEPGETIIPKIPSARILDVAGVLIGNRNIKKVVTGIRPGEKCHEILVSKEESICTIDRGHYYTIKPMLPELTKDNEHEQTLSKEYSSGDALMTPDEIKPFLERHSLLVGQNIISEGEFLR